MTTTRATLPVRKSVNNTAGPDGLVLTLLVYGAYPRISNLDPPAPSITEQAAAIRKAMAEYSQAIGHRTGKENRRQGKWYN